MQDSIATKYILHDNSFSPHNSLAFVLSLGLESGKDSVKKNSDSYKT